MKKQNCAVEVQVSRTEIPSIPSNDITSNIPNSTHDLIDVENEKEREALELDFMGDIDISEDRIREFSCTVPFIPLQWTQPLYILLFTTG